VCHLRVQNLVSTSNVPTNGSLPNSVKEEAHDMLLSQVQRKFRHLVNAMDIPDFAEVAADFVVREQQHLWLAAKLPIKKVLGKKVKTIATIGPDRALQVRNATVEPWFIPPGNTLRVLPSAEF
jgi:hypothetical protein